MKKSVKRKSVLKPLTAREKRQLHKDLQKIAEINQKTLDAIERIPGVKTNIDIRPWSPKDGVIINGELKYENRTAVMGPTKSSVEIREPLHSESLEYAKTPWGWKWIRNNKTVPPGTVIPVDELPYKQKVSFWRKIQNWFRNKFE